MNKKRNISIVIMISFLLFFLSVIKSNAQTYIIKQSLSENLNTFHESYDSNKNLFNFSSIQELKDNNVHKKLQTGDIVKIGKIFWEVFKPNVFDLVLLPLGYIGKSISVSKRLHKLKKIVKKLNTLKKIHGKVDFCQKIYKMHEALDNKNIKIDRILIQSIQVNEKKQKNIYSAANKNNNTFDFNSFEYSDANDYQSKLLIWEKQ